ncbi:flavodoxin domain-containing protein [Allorhodopirellula heiligendammensis]|uniref:Sulfite reductase [NADPH] flavoprotein alpha-component n=1 Tax=Allorhodopirellula heiligendammensis TaxID=2714739 RepID=A0A5C6BHD0_9BACT|nr:flavodoxin domain-containing protein [Allorhodopirellula heiligendammensis]TWU10921.1 Sulfite reductase [NADPH] flavoprotein alpha-component [Allorhodopirellula heiligendammensis]
MAKCCSPLTSTRAANLIAGAALVTAAMLSMWWTPGDWWIATPLPSRWNLATLVLASFLAMLVWTWQRTRANVKSQAVRREGLHRMDPQLERSYFDGVLVVYASETGFAESLAQQTCAQLEQLGCDIRLTPIDAVTHEQLAAARQALFIASTAGQGDPPDHAIEFSQSVMQQVTSLDSLQFGVLALGDRSYDEFCAFGHQINDWLRACGARELFSVIEVDDEDAIALQTWHVRVESLSQTSVV